LVEYGIYYHACSGVGVVLADGSLVHLGGKFWMPPGYDLMVVVGFGRNAVGLD